MCPQQRNVAPGTHISAITQDLVTNVNETCSCNLQTSQVTNAVLQCYSDPKAITFRAVILSNYLQNSEEIVRSIERWVGGGSRRIEVAGELLMVNASCAVEIRFYSDKSCDMLPPSSPSLSPSPSPLSNSPSLSFSPSPSLPPSLSLSPSPSLPPLATSSSSSSSSSFPSSSSSSSSSYSIPSPSSTPNSFSSNHDRGSSSVAIYISISVGIILGITITVIFIIVVIVEIKSKMRHRKDRRARDDIIHILPNDYQQVEGKEIENPLYDSSNENQDAKLTFHS